MANYYASWRSNYFKVKDEAAFKEWASRLPEVDVEVKDGQCYIGQASGGDACGIPCMIKLGDDWADIDLLAELAEHLTDDSVAIIMEVGAEKLRYLVGVAYAVRSSGDVLVVNIGDIYRDVAEAWDDLPRPTSCEY